MWRRLSRYNKLERLEMSDSPYNTNLAAEFYVMSVLHRLGADAALSLGNKKSVDIAVIRSEGESVTIDVKGLAGTTSWPVDNVRKYKSGHFLVFVCYGGKIGVPEVLPDVWIVPSLELEPLVYNSPRGRRVVQRSVMRKAGAIYKDAWDYLHKSL